MTEEKRTYLYNQMREHGLDHAEATRYLMYNDKCPYESIVRSWRLQAPAEEKNYSRAEEMRQETRNSDRSIYDVCRDIREKDEPNLKLI